MCLATGMLNATAAHTSYESVSSFQRVSMTLCKMQFNMVLFIYLHSLLGRKSSVACETLDFNTSCLIHQCCDDAKRFNCVSTLKI